MKRSSIIFLLLAGIILSCSSVRAQSAGERLKLDRAGQTIVLEPYAPNILRVTMSKKRAPALAKPGYGFVAAPSAAGWSASQTPQADVYQSQRIVATVEKNLPPAHPPLQTQIDMGKYFNGSTAGRAHHAAHAGGQKAARTDRLVAGCSESEGRHGGPGPRSPPERSGVLHRGRDLCFARRRALLRAGPESGGLSRSSRPPGSLLAGLQLRPADPASACRFW